MEINKALEERKNLKEKIEKLLESFTEKTGLEVKELKAEPLKTRHNGIQYFICIDIENPFNGIID